MAVKPSQSSLRAGECVVGLHRVPHAEGEVAATLHHEDRRLHALQGRERRARRRERNDGREHPEYAASLIARTPGSMRAGERPDEACDHAGLGETLRDERAAEVGPDSRPRAPPTARPPRATSRRRLRRRRCPRPRSVCRRRRAARRARQRPSARRQLLRAVDPDQPARGPWPRASSRARRSARRPHRPRDHERARAVASEPVEQHHGGPAADRCGASGRVRVAASGVPSADAIVTSCFENAPAGPEARSAAAKAATRTSSTRGAGAVTAAKGSPHVLAGGMGRRPDHPRDGRAADRRLLLGRGAAGRSSTSCS